MIDYNAPFSLEFGIRVIKTFYKKNLTNPFSLCILIPNRVARMAAISKTGGAYV
jgi:hypothetical protein